MRSSPFLNALEKNQLAVAESLALLANRIKQEEAEDRAECKDLRKVMDAITGLLHFGETWLTPKKKMDVEQEDDGA